MSSLILHITSRQAWSDAQQGSSYRAPSLEAEGFIHCSTIPQAVPVAENFYRGRTGLVLLVIDPNRLASGLRWEPPSGGAPPPGVPEGVPFPHIYGPIQPEAVVEVLDFGTDANGHFVLPSRLKRMDL